MAVHPLEELIAQLKQAHGQGLISIILYGSHGRGVTWQDNPGMIPHNHRSNRDILIVLDHVDPHELKRSRAIVEKWREAGNPLPLYIGQDEISLSAEVFPAEFIDLCRARRVLAGRDPFEGFRVPKRNLKHQLEYELESKLIRLRTLYLSSSAGPAAMARLMRDSLIAFSGLFRHVIGLLGHEIPSEKRQSITDLATLLNLDRPLFDRILSHHEGASALSEAEADRLFSAYLMEIRKVIEAVRDSQLQAA